MHVCMSYDCTSADHLKPQSQDAYPQPHAPPQKKSFTTMYLIPCIPVQGQLKKNINVIFCVHSYSFSIRFSSSSIQYTPCRQKYGLSLSVTKQLLNKTVIQLATWGKPPQWQNLLIGFQSTALSEIIVSGGAKPGIETSQAFTTTTATQQGWGTKMARSLQWKSLQVLRFKKHRKLFPHPIQQRADVQNTLQICFSQFWVIKYVDQHPN